MTDEEFAIRYQITSTRGRIYTRTMLLNAASRHPLFRQFRADGVTRDQVRDVLNEGPWMKQRTGMIPAAVVRDAIFEAWFRHG